MGHVSVLLDDVLRYLSPKDGGIYFDGTFGGGGYTKAILDSCNCKVIAVDRDPFIVSIADEFKKLYKDRFTFVQSEYSFLGDILKDLEIQAVDGIVLDLGVSSFQIDTPERGFSFQKNGLLDMRMGGHGKTALDIIKETSETKLADIIYEYGEERFSRRIAKAIKANLNKISTTKDLADVIHSVVGNNFKKDTATKTFQALRIYVNDELGELDTVLQNGPTVLEKGGRFVIVSFHSLEDRLVKIRFNELAKEQKIATILTKKPVAPTEEEINRNVRARSAKLRAIEMTGGNRDSLR